MNIKTTKCTVNAIKNAISRKIVELSAFFHRLFTAVLTRSRNAHYNIFVEQKVLKGGKKREFSSGVYV